MRNTYRNLLAGTAVFSLTVAVMTASPSVQAADFSGKTIQIVVPFGEGSGTNRYARLMQPYFTKYLPGNPTILIVNKPGGSGIKGANWYQKNAKPNGLTVFTGSTSVLNSYVFGGKKAKYKLLTWQPILVSPNGTQFYTQRKNGVTGKDIKKDILALQKGTWNSGGKNPTSAELRNFLAYDYLGMKNVTAVFGMGTGKRRKATIRGELHLTHDNTVAFLGKTSKYVKKGLLSHYMTLGVINADGAVVRDPAFPNIPTVADAYKAVYGKDPSGPQWKAIWHLTNIAVMASKSLWLPAGTPDDIQNTYISVVKKMLKDPAFKKSGGKAFSAYQQSFGKDAKNIVKNAVDINKKTYNWIKDWVKTKYNHNI
jgi:tripartite-type tricarboxylate transporter receptor subunit TctC